MSLAPGTRLGAYEIAALLGAGGMGEVYRARDARLGREVAIKVIASGFSADTDRVQRFEQEARAAATLNHPNILAVHDVGTHEGAPFIVSELLDGETLRERLSGGPLPVRRAIDLGIQIAHALAAAHEKGIIHRDLKPENIFINKDGRAKVLDFGLAKLTQSDSPIVAGTNVPTTPAGNLTHAGTMLGTIGYMAPEQVRGQAVDHRADIFSLGAILYEMLSGNRAFHGTTSIDTVSAILKEDPADLPVSERHIPPALCRVIDRCLEKNAAARFGTADDLAFALDALSTQSGIASVGDVSLPAARTFPRERLAWAAAVAVCLVGLAATLPPALARWRDGGVPSAKPVRFSIPPPNDGTIAQGSSVKLSPDGTMAAFVGSGKDTENLIWIRSLDSLDARPLPGTDGAFQPFWSPDSRYIAFFAEGKLKKIDAAGGPAQTLCALPPGPVSGGTWNKDGIILFSAGRGVRGLLRVAASGGEPVEATKLDTSAKEVGHLWPSFLPDGRRFVYFSLPSKATILGSLDSPQIRTLVTADSRASYAAPGYLLFIRQASLMAQRFDDRQAQLSGDPFPIAERVLFSPATGSAAFDAAGGVLAYRTGDPLLVQISSYDRGGKLSPPIGAAGDFRDLTLSPDGSRLMVHRHDDAAGGGGLWVIDQARGATSKLTFDASHNVAAHWSPDGREVAFTSNRDGGVFNIYKKIASGAGPDELLLKTPEAKVVTDWSPDGRFLVYEAEDSKTALDIWVLPLAGDPVERRKPMPFLRTEAAEGMGRLSPDGHWMAYVSNETGRNEVYVQPFPASGAKWLVSTNGGTQPRWGADGSSLYYLANGSGGAMTLTGVDVRTSNSVFQAGVPKPLFAATLSQVLTVGQTVIASMVTQTYVASRDGQRFFTLSPVPDTTPPAITVTLNWASELTK